MNSSILQALLKLFAIISGDNKTNGSEVVSLFLGNRLSQQQIQDFLEDYKKYVALYHKPKANVEKHTSMTSVKVLRLCEEIHTSLNHHERYLVFVRLVEFVFTNKERTQQDLEFLYTVSDAFHIDEKTRLAIIHFVHSKEIETSDYFFCMRNTDGQEHSHLPSGELVFFRIPEENLFFFRYLGTDELKLNGSSITPNSVNAFSSGSSIRGAKSKPVYYSDVLHSFLASENLDGIDFLCNSISHDFPNGKKALETLRFRASSGNLIGIMGGSGSGKSTLLNILNGNTRPKNGDVLINGKSIFNKKQSLKHLMGYVSQDDILIEELTVFQNLYFNAQLLFIGKSKLELQKMVLRTLQDVGLSDCKDLRVGNVLDKTISGGQRKRLNIALELMREPEVLFVDEPTSGLSSRDSENIMDLLKELTLRGKLIFVVIHQPSSDIFNLFDQLLLLDQGGKPIYYGNPIDSIFYFKNLVNQVNIDESRCSHCGNVNPEQLFNIIEAKVLDDYGNETQQRRITSQEWNNFYNVMCAPEQDTRMKDEVQNAESEKKLAGSNLPNAFTQFKVFLLRDVLGKITNKQYLIVNLLEAPLLAFLLSWFIKYSESDNYVFRENVNLPQYLFITVVVALFMGLSVSSEEIIKDKKILKREKYLNLNKNSYLFSKVGLMFLISAIQTASYVFIGNSILEIHGMFWPYWLILFSTACFANVLGLNISATFNSAKVIYILIPILIIPQLLFSGVIVRFDRLQKSMVTEGEVSWVGNAMASRWAYEALAVEQYCNNAYTSRVFETDVQLKTLTWEKDFWVVEMRNQLNNWDKPNSTTSVELMKSEFARRADISSEMKWATEQIASNGLASRDTLLNVLGIYESNLIDRYNNLNESKENWLISLRDTDEKQKAYEVIMDNYSNESLEEFVTAKNDVKKIVVTENALVRKANPIYFLPNPGTLFFKSHFYAPKKWIGGKGSGKYVETPFANTVVIWLMTLLLLLVLLFDGLNKIAKLYTFTIRKGTDKIAS
jgi:ABC-type multidrug transport system ATPase subunit